MNKGIEEAANQWNNEDYNDSNDGRAGFIDGATWAFEQKGKGLLKPLTDLMKEIPESEWNDKLKGKIVVFDNPTTGLKVDGTVEEIRNSTLGSYETDTLVVVKFDHAIPWNNGDGRHFYSKHGFRMNLNQVDFIYYKTK
jgi:hypothetical protein